VIVPSIACALLTNATDTRFPGNVSFGQQLWLGCHRSFVRVSRVVNRCSGIAGGLELLKRLNNYLQLKTNKFKNVIRKEQIKCTL
jgi:hypothetical protein